jgi:glutamate-1-semialdehyde 2,1-aminomutase
LWVGRPGDRLEAPHNFAEARAVASAGVYPAFFHALLRRGVMLAPGAYEVLFCGLAHSERDLSLVVEAAGDASAEVAKTLAG